MNNGFLILQSTCVALLLQFAVINFVAAKELSINEPSIDGRIGNPISEKLKETIYFDVVSEYQVQQFKQGSGDAEVFSVSLVPSWYGEQWWVSVDATWYHSSSNQFLSDNRFRNVGENLTAFCERYASAGSLLQTDILNRRPNLVAACNAIAASTASANMQTVSGWGDATAYVGYDYALDSRAAWYLSGLLGYKWDNGNIDESLGSGTQELIIGATLSANLTRMRASISADQTLITGGDYADLYDDFSSVSASISHRIFTKTWFGAEATWQQAFADDDNDTVSTTLFLRWTPLQKLQLTIEYSDYLNDDTTIDKQYSGAVTFSF